MTAAESDMRGLLESRVAACRAKDIDRLMSLYAPDIVYFDVVPPLQFEGLDAVRENFLRWFAEYDGAIGLETRNQTIVAGDEVAFASMLHCDFGNRNLPDPDASFWLRASVCAHRGDGGWLITHEHISLPIDFRSASVLMDLEP